MSDLEKLVRDIVREEVQKLLSSQPTPVNDIAQWISAEEVSKRTGLAVITLAKWRMTAKGIPFSKVGSKVAYEVADVEKWMRERKRSAT